MVESKHLRCVHCSKLYQRMTRHQVVLGERQPTEYLHAGESCPRCFREWKTWKAQLDRLARDYDRSPAQGRSKLAAWRGKEPVLGVLEERSHLVDIAAHYGAGQCSCEFWECAVGPALKSLPSVEQAVGKHRCQHIIAARSWALDLALRCHELDRYKNAHGQREEKAA